MARRTYAHTLEHSFAELTLDGVTMSGLDACRRFARRAGGSSWRSAFLRTLHDLVFLNGTVNARTSGTTGPPKPVKIPRTDVVRSARLTADAFGLAAGDRVLHCLPCDFIAGKMMLARAFALDLDLHVIDPRGGVLDNLKVADRFRFAAMVPLQLHRAIQEDRARVERQFETILLGGGPVSDALLDDLRSLGTRVYLGYGSTEMATHVALRKLNGADRSDHFTALGGTTFAGDERGCLVARTPHLRVKEHVTNDLVDLIDDRSFRWLGRIDHVILSGGKKIHPERLEARTAGLIPYPHYFTAVPDERLGQAVMLVIETERPAQEVLSEVLGSITGVLDRHERPQRVAGVRRFARTPGGKVIRGTDPR